MHGVIAVHGVGEHKRGEFLARVSNGLAETLAEASEGGKDPTIRRRMDVSRHPATATLDIIAPNGAESTWSFKEAHWQDALVPPPARTVYRWLLRQGWRQFTNSLSQLTNAGNQRQMGSQSDAAGIQRHYDYVPSHVHRILYGVQIFLLALLRIPILVLLPLLLVLLEFVYYARLVPGLNPFSWLDNLQKLIHKVDPFLSESMGDVQRFMEHGMWAASVRGVVDEILIDMLNDDDVEDITIIAHSLGCVICYQAMVEGGPVAQEINRRLREGRVRKKITFVSLGNAINEFFTAAKRLPELTHGRFDQPLAPEVIGGEFGEFEEDRTQFYWLDIVSRLDPVALGETLDEKWRIQAKVTGEQIKRRLVINLDNPFRDHSFYFVNKALVVPRIARAINGGAYPWNSLAIGAAPGQRSGPSERVRNHIQKVSKLAFFRILAIIAIASYLIAAAFWTPVRDGPLALMEPGILNNDDSWKVYCRITNGEYYSEKYITASKVNPAELTDPRQRLEAETLRTRTDSCMAQRNILGVSRGSLGVAGAIGILLFYFYGSLRRMFFLRIS